MLYIFDKDSTICKSVIEKNGKSRCPNTLDEQDYFHDVMSITENLRAEGHTLAIASNQGGVAFGIFSADEAELLVKAAADYIGAVAYRVCFCHPRGKVAPYNVESYNRKPQPGMLKELMDELGFTPDNTLVVGDWATDQEAARAAGCHFRFNVGCCIHFDR